MAPKNAIVCFGHGTNFKLLVYSYFIVIVIGTYTKGKSMLITYNVE